MEVAHFTNFRDESLVSEPFCEIIKKKRLQWKDVVNASLDAITPIRRIIKNLRLDADSRITKWKVATVTSPVNITPNQRIGL